MSDKEIIIIVCGKLQLLCIILCALYIYTGEAGKKKIDRILNSKIFRHASNGPCDEFHIFYAINMWKI